MNAYLSEIEHGQNGVGDVENHLGVAGNDEEEPICCLEDQVLEFLVRQKRWLVRSGVMASCAHCGLSNGLHVRYGHAQNRELVRLTAECRTLRHHLGEFVDVVRHLVASTTLDFTVILAGEALLGLALRSAGVTVRATAAGGRSAWIQAGSTGKVTGHVGVDS